ncbi:MAG: glycosyltransferase family 2 protein [Candidatus Omnitrophota bacterium]
MMISVVIPFLNEERFIRPCVESVLAQDYGKDNLEILFVDGGSQDGSRKVIEGFLSSNKNMRLLENPKKIVSSGLNIGIRDARGEHVLILSGHAALESGYISSCVRKMDENGAGCVGGKVVMAAEGFIKKAISMARTSLIGGSILPHRYSKQGCFARTAAYGLYKKEVFGKIGLFDESMKHDQDEELNWRIFKDGLKIYFNPEAKASYLLKRDLVGVSRQLFRHTYWKAKTAKKHPGFLKFRFIIPSLFFLDLVFFLIAGAFWPLFFYIFAIQLMLYLAVVFTFSLYLAFKNGLRYLFALPTVYLSIHLSTALGLLAGFITRGRDEKKK